MSLYDFLNSIDLTLEKSVNSYNNSIVDNFVDELKKTSFCSRFYGKIIKTSRRYFIHFR